MAQYAANQTRNTGVNPLSFREVHRVLLRSFFTKHKTNGFSIHPKDEAPWLIVLLEDRCHNLDSNPHSTYQKHQSASSVLLTARPRHFHSMWQRYYTMILTWNSHVYNGHGIIPETVVLSQNSNQLAGNLSLVSILFCVLLNCVLKINCIKIVCSEPICQVTLCNDKYCVMEHTNWETAT